METHIELGIKEREQELQSLQKQMDYVNEILDSDTIELWERKEYAAVKELLKADIKQCSGNIQKLKECGYMNFEKLYFLQDLRSGNDRQVYSGHTGKGKKFQMYNSDYGKYAMEPISHSRCENLARKIEVDFGSNDFDWKITPCYLIELSNFHSDEEYDAYEKLRVEQEKLFTDNRTKLIVVDEQILGVIHPGRNSNSSVEILRGSVLKGAVRTEGSIHIDSSNKVRLATEKDFDEFRVVFGSFGNEQEYEYQK